MIAQLKLGAVRNAPRLAEAIWRKALDGEPFFVGLVMDRLYGRVPQVTRHAGLQDDDGTEQPIPLLLLPPQLTDAIDVEARTVTPDSQ